MRDTVLAAPLLLASACVVDEGLGDRQSGDLCNRFECSPLTPLGLEFKGSRFSDERWTLDEGPKVTAIGGTQTISVIDHATGEILNIPYAPTFDGEGFEVTGHAGNDVSLAANGPAVGHLWLDDMEGRVMDRIQVETGTVNSAEVRTSTHGDWVSDLRPRAIFAGGEAVLTIALLWGGDRIADESVVIEPVSGDLARVGWDEIIVRADTGDVSFAVTAAGMSAPVTLTIPTVATIDDASWFSFGHGSDIGDVGMYCVTASSGGVELAGVPWQFEIEGPGSFDFTRGLADRWGAANCVDVRRDASGAITVIASGPGLVTRSDMDRIERSAPARTPTRRGALGDRARTR
jgi:hypothetical protein